MIWDFQKVAQALESNILVFDCLRKLRFSSIIACNCVIIASSIGKAVDRERERDLPSTVTPQVARIKPG